MNQEQLSKMQDIELISVMADAQELRDKQNELINTINAELNRRVQQFKESLKNSSVVKE